MATFGLAVITKDDYKSLRNLLQCCREANVFDAIVVYDTSDSTTYVDRRRFYEEFCDLPINLNFDMWRDDFALARNKAFELIDTDVVMWLDSDDTFSVESAKIWKCLADRIALEKNPTVVRLPYVYNSRMGGRVPTTFQFRERLFRRADKPQWKSPIHEYCVVEGEVDFLTETGAPIIHNLDTSKPRGDRNLRILERYAYSLGPNVDPRTLYYLALELTQREKYKEAFNWLSYEWLGEDDDSKAYTNTEYAYLEYNLLYLKGLCLYKMMEEKYEDLYDYNLEDVVRMLERADSIHPERNEAKALLIDIMVSKGDVDGAFERAHRLAVDYPPTMMALDTGLYFSYKSAVLCKLAWKCLGDFNLALNYHLESLEAEVPCPLAYENDRILLQRADLLRLAVVTAELGCAESEEDAVLYTNAIMEFGLAGHVYVSESPLAVRFAKTLVVHTTSNTIGKEEVRRGIVQYQSHRIKGYFPGVKIAYAKVVNGGLLEVSKGFQPIECWDRFMFRVLEDLDPNALVSWKAPGIDFSLYRILENKVYHSLRKSSNGGVPYVVCDDQSRLVYVVGRVRALRRMLSNDRTLYVESMEATIPLTENEKSLLGDLDSGVSVRVKGRNLKIAFYAPGAVSWDGLTPHTQGIGASETSVVALAEHLAADNDVTVFSTNGPLSYVRGVLYGPVTETANELIDSNFDIVIVSRRAEVWPSIPKKALKVLWLHDAQMPDLGDVHKYDHVVCVSHYQYNKLAEAIKEWAFDCPAECLAYTRRVGNSYGNIGKSVIGNVPVTPLKVEGVPRKDNSIAWLSSPDRGLDDLVSALEKIPEDHRPLLLTAYGTHNISQYYNDSYDVWVWIRSLYHRIRRIGGGIFGSVSIHDARRILARASHMVYPSEFPETFNCSASEALRAGCRVVVAREAGATANTVSKLGLPIKGGVSSRKAILDGLLAAMDAAPVAEGAQDVARTTYAHWLREWESLLDLKGEDEG